MYRYSQQMRQTAPNSKLKSRILVLLLVLAVTGCAVLGSLYASSAVYRSSAQRQLVQRVRECCMTARTAAGKLTDSVTSDTTQRLAQVAQAVHTMDQLNQMSIALEGERGRLVPAEALDGLYTDLDSYFNYIKTNTTSVMETRQKLVLHLDALQLVLSQE